MRFGFLLAVLFLSNTAQAQYYGNNGGYGSGSNNNTHYVRPSTDNNGNYRQGHYRTNPDNTTSNNYETYGNYNPHNGQVGNNRSGY